MAKIRTLIVDDDADFCDMLRDCLGAEDCFEIVGDACDGEQALRMIVELTPDLVILDIYMPKLDGIGVLSELRNSQTPLPRVVVFSSAGQDELTQRAVQLGASSYFLKPFSMDVFKRRLRRLMKLPVPRIQSYPPRDEPMAAPGDFETEIAFLLHMMAIPPHIRGYRFLLESIAMVVRDVELINQITFRIYPHVAELYGTTPSRVERAMRHAIEVAWNRCRVETIESVFGYTVSASKDKPSNGEFIAMIADKVRLKFGLC